MLIEGRGEFSLKKLILFEGFEKCAQFKKKKKRKEGRPPVRPHSRKNQGHKEDFGYVRK